MRGSSAYANRGQPLTMPNGTVDNPALRFLRERTGPYRAGDGRYAISVKKWRALEITQGDVFTRSNGTAATVIPLSISRANAAAVNQETGQDIYDAAVVVGRETAYREAATTWGRRWYTYSSGLNATPGMHLSAGNNLGIGQTAPSMRLQLYLPNADTAGGAYLQGDNGFATALILGNTTVWSLATKQAVIGMGFAAGKYLGGDADLSIYTSAGGGNTILGASAARKVTIGANDLTIGHAATNYAYFGLQGVNAGRVGIGTTNPSTQFQIMPAATLDGFYQGNAGMNMQLRLGNHGTVGSATILGSLLLQSSGGGTFLGGATGLGDLALATQGSAAGHIWIAPNNSAWWLFHTGGSLSQNVPLANVGSILQINVVSGTDGAFIGSTGNSPSYRLGNGVSAASSTALSTIAMGTVGIPHLGGARDLNLYTSGASAARVILGTHGIAKLILDAASAGVSFMHGTNEHLRINTSGNVAQGLNFTAPEYQYHLLVAGPGGGIGLSAVNAASTNSPAFTLNNSVIGASATRIATFGLSLGAGHFGATNVGDLWIATAGSAAGRVRMGTAGAVRLTLDTFGIQVENMLFMPAAAVLANPPAGYVGLYFAADGLLYRRTSAGAAHQYHDHNTVQPTISAVFTGTRTTAVWADVDATNGKVTLTTKGGDVIVWFWGTCINTSASVAQQIALNRDGTGQVSAIQVYSYASNANFPVPFFTMYKFTGLVPGTYNFTGQHVNLSAIGTMTTTGQLFAMEV